MKINTIFFTVASLLLAACSGGGSGSGGDGDASPNIEKPTNAALPVLSLTAAKGLTFTWTDEADASYYRVQENPDGSSGFTQVGVDIPQGNGTYTITIPLHKGLNARYILQTCNAAGCTDSNELNLLGILVGGDGIGYLKASNTDSGDKFGYALSLSGDGNTLAVGAPGENSNATGIDGNQTDNSQTDAGAVYIFTRDGTDWVEQAYLKASNAEANDEFGRSVSLSNDGNTLAVGAYKEDSSTIGINNNDADNTASGAGAAYVFTREDTVWSQQAYIKASNTDANDAFGFSLSLSGDGDTLAVGATDENSNATGIDGSEANNTAINAGAVYVFTRNNNIWLQEAYIKASNTGADDRFGYSVSLNNNGNTLAVSALLESSNATGIGGNQADNSVMNAGAVYVFTRGGLMTTGWSQQAYIKASNTAGSLFGASVSLNDAGNLLAVGAYWEDSIATGIDGNQTNTSAPDAGAAYIFSLGSGLSFSWSQQAYIKASNTDADDNFGWSVSLSGDGSTLAVGATAEDSPSRGIDGNENTNFSSSSGAAYLFTTDGTTWSQSAYVKASNVDSTDLFGSSVSLSTDGNTLVVGAHGENGNATGFDGDQLDNSEIASGAVYIY